MTTIFFSLCFLLQSSLPENSLFSFIVQIYCKGRDAVPENTAVNTFVYEVCFFCNTFSGFLFLFPPLDLLVAYIFSHIWYSAQTTSFVSRQSAQSYVFSMLLSYHCYESQVVYCNARIEHHIGTTKLKCEHEFDCEHMCSYVRLLQEIVDHDSSFSPSQTVNPPLFPTKLK